MQTENDLQIPAPDGSREKLGRFFASAASCSEPERSSESTSNLAHLQKKLHPQKKLSPESSISGVRRSALTKEDAL